MMNLNQLRAFHAVAKTGAFSKAAEELFVTEPAVFIQVRSLERYLGFKLLDKFGKDLRPTEVGRMLFDYAEKIFGLVEEANKAIKELQDLKSGELRIGSAKALAQYLMPLVISSFQDFYPRIRVLLSESSSDELVRGVLNHQFELAMVARVPYPERVNVVPFSKDRIIVVVSPESSLLKKKEVSLEELNNQPVICRDAGSATKFAVWAEFEKQGLKPAAIVEAGNTEFIKDMVKKDKGYSFLASICVRNEIRKGELATLPLKGGDLALEIDVIHLKGKTLSPAAATFLNFLKESSDLDDLGRTADRIGERSKTATHINVAAARRQHKDPPTDR
jgi:DNA-binding transcriptional LysR family regulator